MYSFFKLFAIILSIYTISFSQIVGSYSTDSTAIRSLLDKMKLENIEVDSVARVYDGRIKALWLIKFGITEVPDEISKLKFLDTLYLSLNNISDLPISITNLDLVIGVKNNRLCGVNDSLRYWLDEHQYCPGFCINWFIFQDCSGTLYTMKNQSKDQLFSNMFIFRERENLILQLKDKPLHFKSIKLFDLRGEKIEQYSNINGKQITFYLPEFGSNIFILSVEYDNSIESKIITI